MNYVNISEIHFSHVNVVNGVTKHAAEMNTQQFLDSIE